MSPIPRSVRDGVLERAGHCCERCGTRLDAFWYSLQHRRARGMGGSRDTTTNGPANLGALCGSATSPDGCHYWVESHPVEALAEGWRVPQGADPARIPVKLHGGRVLFLTADYGYADSVAA